MTEKQFIEYLQEMNIFVTSTQLSQLKSYYEMLVEYNKVMNLTRITDINDVYLKHFYDSATLCKVIDLESEKSLCDIGSGAGFPGLVLKILFPNLDVILVDSLGKRVNFLNEVIKKLELKNISAIHDRGEEYAKKHREEFDIVTARAVTNLSALLEICIPLVKVGKYFVAMKGNAVEEVKNVDKVCNVLDINLIENKTFILPIEHSDRALLKFKKIKKTDFKYPRKYSEIKKHTL